MNLFDVSTFSCDIAAAVSRLRLAAVKGHGSPSVVHSTLEGSLPRADSTLRDLFRGRARFPTG